MLALLAAAALFAFFALVGVAILALARADTASLRVLLTAPVMGAGTLAVAGSVISRLGVPLGDVAAALVLTCGLGAAAVLAWRRPAVPLSVLPVFGVCLAGLGLAGWPMRRLGFGWLANGNDDMSTYVLGASRLRHETLTGGIDVPGFVAGTNWPTAYTSYWEAGARPGSETLLALLSGLGDAPIADNYMPLLLAVHLCGLAAAGALALQAARRWWAAPLAAALLALSPMATFAVTQQLLPQTFGLALSAALLALLCDPELHRSRRARVSELLPVTLLAAALFYCYVEFVPFALAGYGVWLAVQALRRELEARVVLRLWAPVIAMLVVVFNVYGWQELRFLQDQLQSGTSAGAGKSGFDFVLSPLGLPGAVGLQKIPAYGGPRLDESIVLAAALLLGAVVAAGWWARRGSAAAALLLAELGLALYLFGREADFGLFKITMFIAPGLAATVAVWVTGLAGGRARALAGAALLPLGFAFLSTQHRYVETSRASVDVRNISAPTQLPAFRRILDRAGGRLVVSATDNIVIAKLQAADARGRPLRFLGADDWAGGFEGRYADLSPARIRRQSREASRRHRVAKGAFDLQSGRLATQFRQDQAAVAAVAGGECVLALPTGNQMVLNRLALPEGGDDVVARPCRDARGLLVFMRSTRGGHYYIGDRPTKSFHQLEPDGAVPGRTFSAFGRFTLLRVLDPAPRVRVVVDLTLSPRGGAAGSLPPAAVIGAERVPFGLEGGGSARVVSAPVRPQTVAGQPFIALDLGRRASRAKLPLSRLSKLWGQDFPVDPRYVTAYVRNVSLVPQGGLRAPPPAAISGFPAGLADPGLLYSGLYEDGWVGRVAWAQLAAPAAVCDVVLDGSVPAGVAGFVTVRVDGREVARSPVKPGDLRLRAPIARGRAGATHRVELRFSAPRTLPAPDGRLAGALLSRLALVPRAG